MRALRDTHVIAARCVNSAAPFHPLFIKNRLTKWLQSLKHQILLISIVCEVSLRSVCYTQPILMHSRSQVRRDGEFYA